MMVAARRGAAIGAAFSLGFWCGIFAAPRSYEFHTRKQRR